MSNPIGSEYLVMEHVSGNRLHEKWHDIDTLQHFRCTKSLSMMIKEMAALEFPTYDNLYFKSAIDPTSRIDLVEDYCIGPHCGSTYWNCGPGEVELYGQSNSNHGPCESTL